MAYTFTYTDTHTFPGIHGDLWIINDTYPAPGFIPTNMTVSLSIAAPGTWTIQLIQLGGSLSGGVLGGVNIAIGASSGSTSSLNALQTTATGARIRASMGDVPSPPYTITSTTTVTYADALPPPPCIYGTQPSTTAPAIAIITDSFITAALTAVGAPWGYFLFAPLIGYALDSGILCGTGPPAMATITPQSLLDTIEDKLSLLQSIAWYALCQCTPGTPPPVPYTPPTLVQPPGWPTPPAYSCSNADLCTTLMLILRRLDELNSSQSITINQRTTVQTALPGLQYKTGTVHSSLSGSGTLTVANLVGVRVEMTSGSPGRVLPGEPPYLWDVGWMSVSDGGAMLQEKRITRTSFEWFPVEMALTTIFGYALNAGIGARMTELLPA